MNISEFFHFQHIPLHTDVHPKDILTSEQVEATIRNYNSSI